MAANFFYDAMHDVPKPEQEEGKDPIRQVEVFTHGGELYLRVGPVGEENVGRARYTARLDSAEAAELTDAIDRGLSYLGGRSRLKP